MAAPTYLRKNRAGTYYFRIAIPKKFQRLSDDIPREIRFSLKTNLISIASARARSIWTIYQESFEEMGERKEKLPVDEVLKIFADCKAQALLSKAEKEARNRQNLEDSLRKLNPDAVFDADGNVILPVTETKTFQKKLSLSELIQKYMEERDRVSGWRKKTREETLTKLLLFQKVVGDLTISQLTHQQIREYKEIIQKLPANINKIKRYRGKTVTQIIEMKNVEPMQLRTLGKNLEKVKSFLKWSRDQRFIDEDFVPLLNLRMNSSTTSSREAFTTNDLEALLLNPEVIGTAKKPLKKPHQFWVPLLALMTGARIEELCQLHADDIVKVGKIWCISFNDEKEKRLKNPASKRIIPLSKFLIDVGFLRYVEQCRNLRSDRLFPELTRVRDGYSPRVSKWFNSSYRKRHGVTSEGKVFHSFRHTLISHLQDKGHPEPKVAAFVGHKLENVTFGVYGKGYSPESLVDIAEAVDFGIDQNKLKKAATRFAPLV